MADVNLCREPGVSRSGADATVVDGSTGTFYEETISTIPGEFAGVGETVTISYTSPKRVSEVRGSCYLYFSSNNYAANSGCSFTIELYFNSAWLTVYNFNVVQRGGTYTYSQAWRGTTGYWNNVTATRYNISSYANAHAFSGATATIRLYEVEAWGGEAFKPKIMLV